MIEDLFIPPPGAMQFVPSEFPEHYMWVGQPERRTQHTVNIPDGCECSFAWPVISAVDLEPSKPLLGRWVLCACIGKIIE